MSKKTRTSPWRKLSIAIYGAPNEGKVYGTYDLDVTNMMKYIAKRKKEGRRITVTQFMATALGKALYEDAPEVNCYVRRGSIVYRDSADIFVTVIKNTGKDQGGIIIREIQDKTVSDVADYMEERLETTRAGKEKGLYSATKVLAKIPWPFRRIVLKLFTWWSFKMEFKIPFMKTPKAPFGSLMLTNIGTFGLNTGMVALFPIGKIPGVITMGKIEEKPVVIDGEIKIRSIMPITGTFDHRIVDGAQIGKLGNAIRKRIAEPEKLDQPSN